MKLLAKGEQTKTPFFVCEGKAIFPAKIEQANITRELVEIISGAEALG